MSIAAATWALTVGQVDSAKEHVILIFLADCANDSTATCTSQEWAAPRARCSTRTVRVTSDPLRIGVSFVVETSVRSPTSVRTGHPILRELNIASVPVDIAVIDDWRPDNELGQADKCPCHTLVAA